MEILINHLGYRSACPKVAILQAWEPFEGAPVVELVEVSTSEVVLEMEGAGNQPVDGWTGRWFSSVDFSQVDSPGTYYLVSGDHRSPAFEIQETAALLEEPLSDILHYFKSQRSGGVYDRHDRKCPIYGEDRSVDVHGGWYDASGDVSKYLSHLSYANYLNPQQTPMVVWNFLKAYTLLAANGRVSDYTLERILDEATHGGDFLVRMQDEAGFFYMIVFDVWSKDVSQRDICSYATQAGHKSNQYQAGFRQGGGLAIAALAALSRFPSHGDYPASTYWECAEKGYLHLKEHNEAYLDDGKANIIDTYCALLASVELTKAAKNPDQQSFYLEEARVWASELMSYLHEHPDYGVLWMANSEGTRPYFHATEAGLPVLALMEYLSVEPDAERRGPISVACKRSIQAEVSMTQAVWNPFGYARQVTQSLSGVRQAAFFVPHANESGYWWQGENARLASLVSMGMLAIGTLRLDPATAVEIQRYSTQLLDWIFGLNPFDTCMLDGHGRNNPSYWPEAGYYNAKGGVCNGITSGFEDEQDIAFKPEPHDKDPMQNWRWGEQWIPHAGWLFLAIVAWELK